MAKTRNANPGERVYEYGDWSAWVKKGGRGAWWWTLKRDDKTFATSRTGDKTREASVTDVRFLLDGIKAMNRASEIEGMASTGQDIVKKQRMRADAAEKRLEDANLAVRRGHDSLQRCRRGNAWMWVIVLGVAILGWSFGAYAHPGQLSKRDGCHNDRANGEVHWHSSGNERGGSCTRAKHFTVKFQTVRVPVAVKYQTIKIPVGLEPRQ